MKLEDFEVWQLAKELVAKVYILSSKFPKEETYCLKSQIRSSALSVMANAAEGFGRYHYLSKVNFYYNSRGSLAETKSHLTIAKQQCYIKDEEYKKVEKDLSNLWIKLNNTIKSTYKRARKQRPHKLQLNNH